MTYDGDMSSSSSSPRRKASGLALTLLVLGGLLAVAVAIFLAVRTPEELEIPDPAPTSVSVDSVTDASPAIEGSNTGRKEVPLGGVKDEGSRGGKTADASPTTKSDDPMTSWGVDDVNSSDPSKRPVYKDTLAAPAGSPQALPEVQGEQVEVPGLGGEQEGRDGVLTDDKDVRGTSGTPISPQVASSCPGLVNGSVCIPSQKKVVVYHSVGTYLYDTSLTMRIPSTQAVGWLKTTAPVGATKGTSLFAGHVAYKGGIPGPFYRIGEMKMGDDVIVRNNAGRNFLYRVYRIQRVPKTSLPDDLFATSGDPRIALMTCTGTFTAGHFQDRVIVWAAPVEQAR